MLYPRPLSGSDFACQTNQRFFYWFITLLITCLYSCQEMGTDAKPASAIDLLKKELRASIGNINEEGNLDDSTQLSSSALLKKFYKLGQYEPVWVTPDSLRPLARSLIDVAKNARLFGLFPENYHAEKITRIDSLLEKDSIARKERSKWIRMEILLTDAFLTLCRHIDRGHAPLDSLMLDPTFNTDKYLQTLNTAIKTQDPLGALESLEPTSLGYQNLKNALPKFLRAAKFEKKYTYLPYPFTDSIVFINDLIKRLKEESYLGMDVEKIDSATLAQVLKNVQTDRKLKVDGKYGPQVIQSLNNNDAEIFFKVAINMDRYRMQRDSVPEKYLLVNLPGFYMQVYDQDSIALESRVIIGKAKTPTPLLNSQLNQLVVYPTWTIPASIVEDEILPAQKRDPRYLAKKGYRLYDGSGNEIDPDSVKWHKYKKGIPYKIVQGEGIGNALGIMKFNFPNEHFVYLHDTNQRSLFANENRSLSHGCVRVQNWEGLYKYVLHIDSIDAIESNRSFTSSDSVRSWLRQQKRRVIAVKNQLPIFFRYYTAAGKDGKLETYHDVYNLDEPLRKMINASLVNNNNQK